MAAKSDLRGQVVSATEASRSFSAILDRVELGERFLIERHGASICLMAPPPITGRRASECLALVQARAPVLLDGRFGEDLLDIIANEPPDRRPWES